MHDTTTTDHPTLRVPVQAAPIDRTPGGTAVFNSGTGVEATSLVNWAQLLPPSITDHIIYL